MITREIDRIAVYGKTEGLAVYELIGSREAADGGDPHEAWIARYEEGLLKFRKRDFLGAIRCFEAVLCERPHDRPAELMLDRSKLLRESGTDDKWSPVFVLQTK